MAEAAEKVGLRKMYLNTPQPDINCIQLGITHVNLNNLNNLTFLEQRIIYPAQKSSHGQNQTKGGRLFTIFWKVPH